MYNREDFTGDKLVINKILIMKKHLQRNAESVLITGADDQNRTDDLHLTMAKLTSFDIRVHIETLEN